MKSDTSQRPGINNDPGGETRATCGATIAFLNNDRPDVLGADDPWGGDISIAKDPVPRMAISARAAAPA